MSDKATAGILLSLNKGLPLRFVTKMLGPPSTKESSCTHCDNSTLSKEECLELSTPCYCEENVYRILRLAVSRGHNPQSLSAIFISNPERRVPIWLQKAGDRRLDGLCVWDYHVVVAVDLHLGGEAQVYDVDSTLEFPTSLARYIRLALWHSESICAGASVAPSMNMGHQFRCVSFDEMVSFFSSDRRHMMVPGTNNYIHPPPTYPCIVGRKAESPHTLPLFLAMSNSDERDQFLVRDMEFAQLPGVLYSNASSLLAPT